MILIGQYDSSFVRRVAIALKLYGLPFEHRPWSVFSDVHQIRTLNPLTRVPTLVLDDEDVLFDSHLILMHQAVALFYEQVLHSQVSPVWVERCRAQMAGALTMLEEDRAFRTSTYWFGEEIGHADIAVACAVRHAREALPEAVTMQDYPALHAHCDMLEALAVFREISQAFIAPA
jgi:glutathione S-transferase